MEFVLMMTIFGIVICALDLAAVIFGILYMHYTAAAKNKKLSPAWYVCGVLFSFWTLIVFLVKSKDFPGEDTKECPQCGDRFFSRFEICPKCLVELPPVNSEENQRKKNLGRIFGIMVLVCYVLIIAAGFVSNGVINNTEWEDYGFRISVDGVYYDKHGNSYENEEDVLLYDEEGNVYFYTAFQSEVDTLSEDYFYVNEAGDRCYEFDCYVTEDGWFYCDKRGSLYPYEPDFDSMTDKELDEYYEAQLDTMYDEYRYYDYPYTDGEGNFYYCAYEASWNADGELILAHNDTSLTE